MRRHTGWIVSLNRGGERRALTPLAARRVVSDGRGDGDVWLERRVADLDHRFADLAHATGDHEQ